MSRSRKAARCSGLRLSSRTIIATESESPSSACFGRPGVGDRNQRFGQPLTDVLFPPDPAERNSSIASRVTTVERYARRDWIFSPASSA